MSGQALARWFQRGERLLYTAVAVALAMGGAGLFVYVVGRFFSRVGSDPFIDAVLGLLDGLLLVFIVTELLHTVRAVIAEHVLLTEPFLIVGIVAAIRRLIVISAEAPEMLAGREFTLAMTEMGVLIAGILVLGITIFLLRHTDKPEPRPRDASEDSHKRPDGRHAPGGGT